MNRILMLLVSGLILSACGKYGESEICPALHTSDAYVRCSYQQILRSEGKLYYAHPGGLTKQGSGAVATCSEITDGTFDAPYAGDPTCAFQILDGVLLADQ